MNGDGRPTQPSIAQAQLFACNGHYDAYHGKTTEGCGTVFAAGVGPDDIYESEEVELPDGRPDRFLLKSYCPVCAEEDVVVVPSGHVPVAVDY